jgi:hypothetical protein
MLVNHLEPFFWDVDIHNFDPQQYPRYTIARLLEYGDLDGIGVLGCGFSHESSSPNATWISDNCSGGTTYGV